jgi:type I restriction enzyme S subunit
MPIQRKIANVLNQVNILIEKRKEQIKKLDLLVKSRFVGMFGDPVTNPMGWDIIKLGSAFEITSGGTPATQKPDYWDNGTINWIGSNMCQDCVIYKTDGKFITELGLRNSSAKVFEVGTVLIALVGATIGKTALLRISTSTNQNIAGIAVWKNPNYSSEYVYYSAQCLYTKFMELGVDKFKMANLSFVRNLEIMSPPSFLQIRFTDFFKQINKLRFELQCELDKMDMLYKSLMQKCFQGELF